MKRQANHRIEYRNSFLFGAWNYEKFEKWLSDLSAQGSHFTKQGFFRLRFEKDPSARYEYLLDYQAIRDPKEKAAYFALFEDCGWTHVDTSLGWHYYRRPYVDGDRPAIYSDRSSLKQLWRRLQFLLVALAFGNLVIAAVNTFNLNAMSYAKPFRGILLASVLFQILVTVLLAYGCMRFQRKIKKLDQS